MRDEPTNIRGNLRLADVHHHALRMAWLVCCELSARAITTDSSNFEKKYARNNVATRVKCVCAALVH